MTLRKTIAEAWYANFYGAQLANASAFRKVITRAATDAILAAMRDYVLSEEMFTACYRAGEGGTSQDMWRAMIEAAMAETDAPNRV